MKKTALTLALVLVLSVTLAGCAPKEPPVVDEAYKVALVLPGPINDAGWNQSAHGGLVKAETELGVEIAYSESVGQPDYETVMRDYATQGYNLIIATGFQFTDAAKNVAAQYPDVDFVVINGREAVAPNLASYTFDSTQSGFLVGAFAGMMTESNVVAMMVADKSPIFEQVKLAFEAGAKYVNPDVTALTAYTNTMSDIAKGKEIGIAFIDEGADWLSAAANQVGLGAIDAAKERGINYIGFIANQKDVAPETVKVSVMQFVGRLVYLAAQDGQSGTLEATVKHLGINEGAIAVSDYTNPDEVPQEVKDRMLELIAAIKDGSLREQGILPAIIE